MNPEVSVAAEIVFYIIRVPKVFFNTILTRTIELDSLVALIKLSLYWTQASRVQSITFTVYAYDDVNGRNAKVGQ